MATYKVLQDIEAEDKLIGPLTLRQFIYALVAAFNGYLTFMVITKGVAFMAAIFLPLTIVTLFFAWPWSRDQPTEIWALARIRFLVKPRIRIWNQSGVRELVTITAPKKMEAVLTNGLTQSEVESRLRALADTIDSRGWAIKNVNVSMYGQAPLALNDPNSDRLVNMSSLPQPVSNVDVKASDDMLDVQNNPVAAQFDSMIAASARAHRQQIMDRMQDSGTTPIPAPTPVAPPAPAQPIQTPRPQNYWFLNEPTQATSTVPQDNVTFNTQVVTPGKPIDDDSLKAAAPTADEEQFIKQLKPEPAFSPNMHGHLHVIKPLSEQQAEAKAAAEAAARAAAEKAREDAEKEREAAKMTQQADADILDLARNNDLNVATIAREANKRKEPPQDEVVISLH
ncbi:MAG TPA: PrgI family protein [Candidatus Saccharimonadales bacterium]|nr:PrgI family protein [Candidatus Saccharimonadales bacterium]